MIDQSQQIETQEGTPTEGSGQANLDQLSTPSRAAEGPEAHSPTQEKMANLQHKINGLMEQLQQLPAETSQWVLDYFHPSTVNSLKAELAPFLDQNSLTVDQLTQLGEAFELLKTAISYTRTESKKIVLPPKLRTTLDDVITLVQNQIVETNLLPKHTTSDETLNDSVLPDAKGTL